MGRVENPLAALKSQIKSGMHALIACIELSYDVPKTSENTARKPKGIPLEEIDIYVKEIQRALEEFDATAKEAIEKAAEEASAADGDEFDILPREEIFLVSSFILNVRIVAYVVPYSYSYTVES